MSMPTFPDPCTVLTHEEAINAILTSIALEETALSHIINAEGEKIQYALDNLECNTDIQLLLEVNESVADMLEQIADMQLVLVSKLNKVLKCFPKKHDVNATSHHPCSPTRPPEFCPDRPCPERPCPSKPTSGSHK